MNYIIITPAYNEQKYIAMTIESVIAQSLRPTQWLIVDDGSTDKMADIIQQYTERYPWIRYVYRHKELNQTYYASNVFAIMQGIDQIKSSEYDFLAILDADISLPSDYYEQILKRIQSDAKLGVASGVYVDRIGEDKFKKILSDRRSTPKALMVFRKQCYEDIGGFTPMKYGGEDTCACFMARMKGWKTWSFQDLIAIHNKPVGMGHARNILKIRFRQGKAEYYMASPWLFMLTKCIRRCFKESPFLLSGLSRLTGYITASLFMREKRQIPQDLINYIKTELNSRVWDFNRIPDVLRAGKIQ